MIPLIAEGIISVVTNVISRLLPETPQDKLAELQVALNKELADNELLKGQLDIDQAEAGSSSLFVAGWRPMVGWVCASAFAWAYLVEPVIVFVGASIGHPVSNLPTLNTADMMTVLFGLLGMGGLRTYEKTQNVHNKH